MSGATRLKAMGKAAAALLVAAVFFAPLVWLVSASLKPEARIHADVSSLHSFVPTPATGENYVAAAERSRLATVVLNSFVVVVLIAGGGLIVNAMAAYAFARMKFPGRDAVFLLLIASIILPLEVIVVPLFVTIHRFVGMADILGERGWTFAALSVPFMAKAFNIFLLRQCFISLPRSLEEAAFLDGAGWWRTFWRVALPNAGPAIATVVLLDVVVHWNDFLWPLVVCRGEAARTVQLGLAYFFTQPPIAWGAIMAYALVATLPVMVVFVAGQRWIVRSTAMTGLRG